MTWHASDRPDRRHTSTTDSTRPGPASLEQHLLTCETCRRALAAAMPTDELDQLWADVIDAVDRPRPLVVERVLGWIGVRPHVARLLAATPSLADLVARGARGHPGRRRRSGRCRREQRPHAGALPRGHPAAPAGQHRRRLRPRARPGLRAHPGTPPTPSARLFLQRSTAVLVTSIGLGVIASAVRPDRGLGRDAVAAAGPGRQRGVTLALSTWMAPCGRPSSPAAAGWSGSRSTPSRPAAIAATSDRPARRVPALGAAGDRGGDGRRDRGLLPPPRPASTSRSATCPTTTDRGM